MIELIKYPVIACDQYPLVKLWRGHRRSISSVSMFHFTRSMLLDDGIWYVCCWTYGSWTAFYLYVLEKQRYFTLTQGKQRFYSSKPRNYLHLKTCLLFSALGDWSLRRTLTSSCATSASASFSGRWATNSGQVGVVDFACCEEKCLAICLTSG